MKTTITARDVLLIFCAFCCIHVVVFTHIPVTADRSISVFMLGYMAQEDIEYTKADLEDVFIEKYVYQYGAFDKRLDEQVYTGTIEKTSSGGYILTGSGKRIIAIYNKVADWFDIEKKLINPN